MVRPEGVTHSHGKPARVTGMRSPTHPKLSWKWVQQPCPILGWAQPGPIPVMGPILKQWCMDMVADLSSPRLDSKLTQALPSGIPLAQRAPGSLGVQAGSCSGQVDEVWGCGECQTCCLDGEQGRLLTSASFARDRLANAVGILGDDSDQIIRPSYQLAQHGTRLPGAQVDLFKGTQRHSLLQPERSNILPAHQPPPAVQMAWPTEPGPTEQVGSI